MPKLTNNRVPTYRFHRCSGQAVVTLCGKDHYLGPHGSQTSKNEYDRLIAEWLANGRTMYVGASSESALTMVELIAKYWVHVTTYYVKDGRPTSEQGAVKNVCRLLRKLYGRVPAEMFGPSSLKAFRQQLIDKLLSRKHINDQVSRVKLMFKWAVSNELVSVSVYQALQTVSGLRAGRSKARETEPVRPVADEHVDAIRTYVSRHVWAMIELQRMTGMRPGEVVIMRAADIDMTGSVWRYSPAVHKTEHHGHTRIVDLGPQSQAVVREFLSANTQAYLFSPLEAEEERRRRMRGSRKTPVQPSQLDRRKPNPRRRPRSHYTTDTYRRAIQRACDKANASIRQGEGQEEASIPRWHPHQLRHNFATRIRKQYGLEVARLLLGHRTMAVTEVYAEIDRNRVTEVALQAC